MHRRLALSLLAAVLFLCPGCTTALLWSWAGEEEVAGELLGVMPDARGDVVLYEFDETEEFSGGTVAVRIAPGWRKLPVKSLATTPVGDALALATPFAPVQNLPLGTGASLRSLHLIDFRNTVGRQVVSFGAEDSRYGFVELMNDREEIVHELYGYNELRGQWVRVASVNLGAFQTSSARVSAGIALTPVTFVLDLAMFTAFVWALGESGGGGSLSGLDFPSGGNGRGEIITFSDRTRYWRSLSAPAGPGIR